MPVLKIDTATVPVADRVEFWSESSCQAYHPVQIRAEVPFFARLWAYELGPLSVYRIAASPNTMIRTSRLIAAGDPECLHVETILSGRVNAAQEGRNGVARAGDIISYETSHPAVMRADEPFESVVVRVPRRLLGPHADAIAGATALPVSGRRAAATFLGRLAARLDSGAVAADEVPKTVSCVLELVRGLYAGADRVSAPTRLRTRAEILLGVESYIDAHLGDPDLEPEQIARASFISTRYLHKLFESEGTSVCGWIRATRLERCRRDLADPGLGHQTILAIATRWGLPGAQNFSRVFRAAYGCSPNEFRRAAANAG
jgi:AraC-like DNA-binding protein